MQDRAAWFAERGWGVFCCYLGAPPSTSGGRELSSEAWNAQVDSFDVEGLADQLVSVGAPYFFITVGQGSGHYCAPNPTYDRIAGVRPSKCSRRDLVSDLYEILNPLGIDLLVYTPAGGPWVDFEARKGLGMTLNWNDPGVDLKNSSWAEFRLVELMRNWEAIVRDWSVRWGDKVRGWWVDGCYHADVRYPEAEEPNFKTLAAALRAGNPDAIVAFNPGVLTPVIHYTRHEDYTAGEISAALPECPGPWVKNDGHKARYHVLSYLGETWCKGDPRFPNELVAGYTKHVISRGGIVTWDVPIQKNGLIPEPFVDQLKALKGIGK